MTFATKSGDSGGANFPVSIGRYLEHVEPQEEGQSRVGDHLREKVPILEHQPVAPYGLMELEDEILLATISRMRDKLSHIPTL